MTQALAHYKYGGARAAVLLHEQHMRDCLAGWKQAKAADITLPETTDKSYASLETLLTHILRASRGYMVWMCRHLELPNPGIKSAPEPDQVETEAEAYLEHLLERWRLPLANVSGDKFGPTTYVSNWGTHYCIDAMLEHAVMHPIKHEFQLKNLLEAQS